jgi:hypothetical protein
VFDFFANGGQLTRAFTAANDKIIGESTYFADIQQDDVRGLFFSGGFYCLAGDFNTFQRFPPRVKLLLLYLSIAQANHPD